MPQVIVLILIIFVGNVVILTDQIFNFIETKQTAKKNADQQHLTEG